MKRGRLRRREEEFRRDWLANMCTRDLEQRYGLAYMTLWRHAKTMGLPPRRPCVRGPDPLGPRREAWFRRRWGIYSTAVMAKYLRVCPNTVVRTARRLGLPIPRPGRKPRDMGFLVAAPWKSMEDEGLFTPTQGARP